MVDYKWRFRRNAFTRTPNFRPATNLCSSVVHRPNAFNGCAQARSSRTRSWSPRATLALMWSRGSWAIVGWWQQRQIWHCVTNFSTELCRRIKVSQKTMQVLLSLYSQNYFHYFRHFPLPILAIWPMGGCCHRRSSSLLNGRWTPLHAFARTVPFLIVK